MAETEYHIKCSVCNEIKESKAIPFIKIYQRNVEEPNTGSYNTGADVCWDCLKERLRVNKK